MIFSVCLVPLNMPSAVATYHCCSPHQYPHLLLFFNDALHNHKNINMSPQAYIGD